MGFLDNSGDIILDAVLTDTGRMRLARGDGTFKIAKFALGDDEINYSLYDKNNASGSAYYDLQILQTPVLEAFTNNASSMKSRLLSIQRTDILYLPVMAPNILGLNTQPFSLDNSSTTYIIMVDLDTVNAIAVDENASTTGLLNGNTIGASQQAIQLDQGLNTTQIAKTQIIDPDLKETQYLVEMDNRLGTLYAALEAFSTAATVSFIDDDNIATYYLTSNTDTGFVTDIGALASTLSPIAGPRGTKIAFKIGAQQALKNNSYLFDVLGTSVGSGGQQIGDMDPDSAPYKFIDTMISVTGVTTGYRLDVPVRYVKKD